MSYRITEDCKGCGHCVQWCPTKAIKGRRRVSFVIDPARCIDCGVCGRICTYSAVVRPDGNYAERMRMSQWRRPNWDFEACTNCDHCVSACPVKCIQNARSDAPESSMRSGYPYLTRQNMCIGCGFCSAACDVGAIRMQPLEYGTG